MSGPGCVVSIAKQSCLTMPAIQNHSLITSLKKCWFLSLTFASLGGVYSKKPVARISARSLSAKARPLDTKLNTGFRPAVLQARVIVSATRRSRRKCAITPLSRI